MQKHLKPSFVMVEDKVVQRDVLNEHFACNLSACKGACCVEGEAGAPLTREEASLLEDIYPLVEPFLLPEGKRAIAEEGTSILADDGDYETPLTSPGGPCAYLIYQGGIAKCGLEKAWEQGAIPFRKPISCHLYPVRAVERNNITALYYHHWEICSAACTRGEKENIRVFRFVKDALVRAYGQGFYDRLEELAGE